MVNFSFYSPSADNDSSDVGGSCFNSCNAFDAYRTSYGLYVPLDRVPTELLFPCLNRYNSDNKKLVKCSASVRVSVLNWYCRFMYGRSRKPVRTYEFFLCLLKTRLIVSLLRTATARFVQALIIVFFCSSENPWKIASFTDVS